MGLGPFGIPLLWPWLLAAAAAEILGGAAVAAAVGALFGKLFEHDVETRHLARWAAGIHAGGWLPVARGDAAELALVDEERGLPGRPSRRVGSLTRGPVVSPDGGSAPWNYDRRHRAILAP